MGRKMGLFDFLKKLFGQQPPAPPPPPIAPRFDAQTGQPVAQPAPAPERAVTLDREARQRLKEQKRAESAERKRKRAEAVAWRKATDITFLGRAVSAGLADRHSQVAKLESAGLPVYATPADLAQAM